MMITDVGVSTTSMAQKAHEKLISVKSLSSQHRPTSQSLKNKESRFVCSALTNRLLQVICLQISWESMRRRIHDLTPLCLACTFHEKNEWILLSQVANFAGIGYNLR